MAGLSDGEVYRKIKPVDLASVLADLPSLPFFAANIGGGRDPRRYACDVLLKSQFPPSLHACVSGLDLGGRCARVLLRRLSPKQSIPPHVDEWMPQEADWRRFQVPLVTHPAILMRWPADNIAVHLEAGWLYEVRFDRMHEVINDAPIARTHLQIDQVGATI